MSWTDPNQLDGVSTADEARYETLAHFAEFNDENIGEFLEYRRENESLN